MNDLANAVFALLHGSAGIVALCDARITPGIIPQAQDVPCMYYGTDQIKPVAVRDPMGCYQGKFEVGFQVEEDAYDQLEALTGATRGTLDNFRGIVAGVSITLGTGQSTPDDFDAERRLHTRALEYDINARVLTS